MRPRLVTAFVIALVTVVLAQRVFGAADAEIAGCLSDATAQRLAGATVIATAGGVRRTTTADAAGCYRLKSLPPASYRVTARLSGFYNVTVDGVALASGSVTRLDLVMRISSICECIGFVGNLADHWKHADAVLSVRLAAAGPGEPAPAGYYRHAATVLEQLKPVVPGGRGVVRVFVLQNQRSGASEPYDVGQELVVFLHSSQTDTFTIANDEPGLMAAGSDDGAPAAAFLVQDGRIRRAPAEFSRYVGLRVEILLGDLRALAQ
jgi:Carboxypeptidase regulatory-like domain